MGYTNMNSVEEMNKAYFTEEGNKTLHHLLDSYLTIFNNKKITYPTKIIIYGLPQSTFDAESEVYGRIKMVSDLTGVPINIKFVEEEYEDKTKKIQCYITKVEVPNDTAVNNI